uniref:Uncharacterized protein n=1 Tax=Myoviridae sp. ct2DO6 TaxID=2825020 RepID=A0A8S5Q0W0_9CAUD|nr:MAG TPA: hypothetical protein [Myoviridae sp. ct2DO6]
MVVNCHHRPSPNDENSADTPPAGSFPDSPRTPTPELIFPPHEK